MPEFSATHFEENQAVDLLMNHNKKIALLNFNTLDNMDVHNRTKWSKHDQVSNIYTPDI